MRLRRNSLGCGDCNGGNVSVVDFEGRSMSREINRIAEKFLHQFLQQNPQVESPRICCSHTKRDASYSHEAAEQFLQQVQDSVESDRIEVTEPTSVIILRKGRPVQFLAGFRHRDSKPVWCYDARLAGAVSADEAEEFVKALRSRGVETFTMPAPEKRYGSL
jgi:hypothetical protein